MGYASFRRSAEILSRPLALLLLIFFFFFSISNVLICIIGHLTTALSVIKNNVYKITFVDETHLHPGRHYFLTALNKSLRTSRETNFRLIQEFNWSKNNFREIHISQGLDWVFPSVEGLNVINDTKFSNILS